MMSVERDLLKRVLDTQHNLSVQIAYEIQELLAQPEQTVQEPVAWKDRTYGNLHHVDWGDSIPLYTSPPKRLSNIDIKEASRNAKDMSFYNGVKWDEAMHGITGVEMNKEIEDLLAQPEQTVQEPVAWMWEQQSPHSGEWDSEFAEGKPQNFRVVRNIRPLYTSPQKREPLSEDDVTQIINTKHFDTSYTLQQSDKNNLRWYRQGVKDAGEAYGIGVDND
jgi:hypothetical protein